MVFLTQWAIENSCQSINRKKLSLVMAPFLQRALQYLQIPISTVYSANLVNHFSNQRDTDYALIEVVFRHGIVPKIRWIVYVLVEFDEVDYLPFKWHYEWQEKSTLSFLLLDATTLWRSFTLGFFLLVYRSFLGIILDTRQMVNA